MTDNTFCTLAVLYLWSFKQRPKTDTWVTCLSFFEFWIPFYLYFCRNLKTITKAHVKLTSMLNSKALTASSRTFLRSSSLSSMLFILLLYSCLKRWGLVTPGNEKNATPSLPLSPMAFWVIFPRTWPPDRSPR